MTTNSAEMIEQPDLARYFFEIGYGACFGDAFIANKEVMPFALNDAMMDRAWEIAQEIAGDDPETFDSNLALALARQATPEQP